jgi:hypothetical protein
MNIIFSRLVNAAKANSRLRAKNEVAEETLGGIFGRREMKIED